MGFRFQRRVSLFPGVRLNFSASGVSTTIGVRGASVNIGSRGSYVNLGIPGSGLSYRERLSGDQSPTSHPSSHSEPYPHEEPEALPQPYGETVRFDSREFAVATSHGLEGLKHLVEDAQRHRAALQEVVTERRADLVRAHRKLAHAQAFILRVFLRNKMVARAHTVHVAQERLDAALKDLDACVVDVDFGIDENAFTQFLALADTFDALCACQRIWDITSASTVDKVKERTTARYAFDRKSVQFSRADFGIVHSEQLARIQRNALRISSVDGNSLYLYPGLAVIAQNEGRFALLSANECRLQSSESNFIEEEGVPGDSPTIGYTWKKANKDGSRDMRFQGNYQIPIARYGSIRVEAPQGFIKLFQFSDSSKSNAFSSAFAQFQASLHRSPTASAQIAYEGPPDDPPGDSSRISFIPPALPRSLVPDWIAMVALAAMAVVAVMYGPQWLSRLSRSSPAVGNAQTTITDQAEPKLAVAPIQRETMRIRTTTANIRAQPSTAASIVRKAHRGAQYQVFDRKGRWVQVGDGAPIGWVRDDLLEDSGRGPQKGNIR